MTSPTAVGATLLSLTGITKRFGGTLALDDVSFEVRGGTVHALLGENGAGKSTLMRIAFGLIAPDSGRVATSGNTPVASPTDAIRAGVGMVHQHFTNVPAMSVAENVALGGQGRYHREDAERAVTDIGARTGMVLDPRAVARELTVAAQQRLEIVKALARDASLLILDEPTAVLAPNEIDELLRWMRGFADAGNAVVLITHKLREALAIADDVTVLRRGRVALQGDAKRSSIDDLSRAMLGEELAESTSVLGATTGDGRDVAVAEQVSIVGERGVEKIRGATFAIRAGDIVGIAAVDGAGQRELIRALAGRSPIASGTLRLPPAVGFVPEDRHHDALVLEFSTTENLALHEAGRRGGRIDWQTERTNARRALAEFNVRGADERTPVRNLSGGNQQKLVLARELAERPSLVVVENPTRGLDVRATRDVHDRLRAAAREGAAVVVYASDLDEVLTLATRVFVVHAGVVRETVRDRDVVGRAMLGVGLDRTESVA